jgi:hypothetical protein
LRAFLSLKKHLPFLAIVTNDNLKGKREIMDFFSLSIFLLSNLVVYGMEVELLILIQYTKSNGGN